MNGKSPKIDPAWDMLRSTRATHPTPKSVTTPPSDTTRHVTAMSRLGGANSSFKNIAVTNGKQTTNPAMTFSSRR